MVTFLLFAMNRTCSSDIERVKAISRHGVRCITVAECNEQKAGEHLSVDFHCPRGWGSVLRFVTRLCAESSVPLIAFLDYFWLETRYFERRYGLDWYTHKAGSLLNAGVSKVYLPHANEIADSLQHLPKHVSVRKVSRTTLSDLTDLASIPLSRGTQDTHFARLRDPPFLLFQTQSVFDRSLQVLARAHVFFLIPSCFSALSLCFRINDLSVLYPVAGADQTDH